MLQPSDICGFLDMDHSFHIVSQSQWGLSQAIDKVIQSFKFLHHKLCSCRLVFQMVVLLHDQLCFASHTDGLIFSHTVQSSWFLQRNCPGPHVAKHPQTMTKMPSCLIFTLRSLLYNAVCFFFFCQTPRQPKYYTNGWFIQRMSFQSYAGSSRWIFFRKHQ